MEPGKKLRMLSRSAWQEEEAGTDSLAYALSQSGNFAVHWIRWENE